MIADSRLKYAAEGSRRKRQDCRFDFTDVLNMPHSHKPLGSSFFMVYI